MSDAPRKPRRAFGLLPLFLAALAAAGWSAWWFVARDRIVLSLDAEAARLREAGYDIGWSERTIGGYPFRFFVQMKDARIAEPGGWGLAASRLEAETAAYAPTVVVFVAPEGITLSRPDGRAFAIDGEAIRASIGGFKRTPPRISIEGLNLTIAATTGEAPAFTAMKRFEAHLRPVEGDKAQLMVSAEDAAVSPDGVLGRIASGAPVSVRMRGEYSKAASLKGQGWPGAVRNWGAAGGVLEIAEGGVRAGESMLNVRPSRLGADAEGRAQGTLSVALTRASEGMLALGAVGAIPEETAAVGAGLAGATQGRSGIEATLTFQGGQTLLGPLPLGPAPRLY
jgi:hypothetical protein